MFASGIAEGERVVISRSDRSRRAIFFIVVRSLSIAVASIEDNRKSAIALLVKQIHKQSDRAFLS